MSVPGFAPTAPESLAGRVLVTISGYTDKDLELYRLSEDAQADECAVATAKTYHAVGFPPQGIALQIPSGAWYSVDRVLDGTRGGDGYLRVHRISPEAPAARREISAMLITIWRAVADYNRDELVVDLHIGAVDYSIKVSGDVALEIVSFLKMRRRPGPPGKVPPLNPLHGTDNGENVEL